MRSFGYSCAWSLALVAVIVFASGGWQTTQAALSHGDMEDASSYTICPGWTYYSVPTITGPLQSKSTTTVHGGLASQKLVGATASATARMGIYQTITASAGDAFTFDGWVNASSNPTVTKARLAARWDGSTTITDDALTGYSTFQSAKNTWSELTGLAGNATTAGGVTLFLDARRVTNAAAGGYWDDITAYQAFVPPAPAVGLPAVHSLPVNVDPGSNSTNSSAQFAITVGGGAYALGTNWVQTDGSVGSTPAWLTDAQWDNGAVTGLASNTTYNFEVEARYSSAIPQATVLQGDLTIGTGTTTPEPATVAFLALGGLAMLRRRR